MLKIGLIINQYAGLGGKVGLKGSDGDETVRKAFAYGARPESSEKAMRALRELLPVKNGFALLTCAGEMGEAAAKACGLPYEIVYSPVGSVTNAKDTVCAARALAQLDVGLLLFAGGDGTARDMLDAIGRDVPVLGIPTGCKIHSAVYAINPKLAGVAVRNAIERGFKTREAEVMDIDEDKFRQDIVSARLYGYLSVVDDQVHMQNLKSGHEPNEAASMDLLANCVVDAMEGDVLYLIGSGSTLMAVKKKLGIRGTLLGVDLVQGGKLVLTDANERQLLDALKDCPNARLIITVIGGQGYLFGRGNQQLSAAALKRIGKENIQVIMTKAKADSLFLRNLYIDTADEEADALFSGYYRVLVGYENYVMFKAVGGSCDSSHSNNCADSISQYSRYLREGKVEARNSIC